MSACIVTKTDGLGTYYNIYDNDCELLCTYGEKEDALDFVEDWNCDHEKDKMLSWGEWNNWRKNDLGYMEHNRTCRKQMYRRYSMDCQEVKKTSLSSKDFYKARDALMKANIPTSTWVGYPDTPNYFQFGTCNSAPTLGIKYSDPWQVQYYNKEQGNNPMKTEYTTATATITTAPSEVSTQRNYLFDRLNAQTFSYRDPKYKELKKLFNIDAPESPQNGADMIAAIQGGKFTVDDKKFARAAKARADSEDCHGYDEDGEYIFTMWYGVTFTDLPKADRKGYDAAVSAYQAQIETVRDTIMIGTPAEGLAALTALKLWTPTQTAPTTATTQ